jgi:type 1 glutamine amidotransferase/nicotinamidase-related amidase
VNFKFLEILIMSSDRGKMLRKFFLQSLLLTLLLFNHVNAAKEKAGETLTLNLRSQVQVPDTPGRFKAVNKVVNWNPKKTAIIICDMWNEHWCKGATKRVDELSRPMNDFVKIARQKGVLIVHSPSDIIDYYKDYPGRRRAQENLNSGLPDFLGSWAKLLDHEKESLWPIDQSDGGCDCQTQCPQHHPWSKQIETIEILDSDIISDRGLEIASVFAKRNIENVIIMGVHTNMCVIGRPFGLRNMVRLGKNTVLLRDLTDTMYNSRKHPYVTHFTGTDLIVEYIERYVCPTIASTDLTHKAPFKFKEDKRDRIVLISAESEYDADQSFTKLAHELMLEYNMSCQILQGSTAKQGPQRNYIPQMEHLLDADLVMLFARRRAIPDRQMKLLRAYLNRGKPLIAFRTSSHAFVLRDDTPKDLAVWPRFDEEVLGCRYDGYPHGQTLVTIAADAKGHPILKGLNDPYTVRETMYRSSPLADSCSILLMGKCIDGNGDDRYRKNQDQIIPDEPLAWTNTYKNAKVFYTSLGSGRASFKEPWFQKMIINAVFWALDKPAPHDDN